MKSGGSGGSAPNRPQPQGSVAPYGQASKFNPQYNSVLPVDAAGEPVQTQTAQLTDPMRMESGNRTPLLEQQEAMPIAAAGPSPEDKRRRELAMIMAMFGGGRNATGGFGSFGRGGDSGGYSTSGRGGSFGGTGSSARSGGLS